MGNAKCKPKKLPEIQVQPVDNLSPKKHSRPKSYGYYSSLAFQAIVIIVGFIFLGRWLDGYHSLHVPLATIFCIVFGSALGLYVLIKGLSS